MIIGITGIIGTGKSTASKHLAEKLGCKLIDADVVGHTILKDNYSKTNKLIKKEFGTVNRQELGELVFNDLEKLKKLEELIHPEMFRLIETSTNYLKEQGKDCVLEAAVLHKMGLEKLCNKVILIKSSTANIIKRLQEKGLSQENIEAKLNSLPIIPEENTITINNDTDDLSSFLEKISDCCSG